MKKFWDSQFGNLFYWVPICLAFGAATYFIMPIEFCPPYACALAIVALVLACLSKMPIILRAIFLFVFGFLYAAAFTDFIATPQLNRDLRDIEITGEITNTNFTDTRTRIFVRVNGADIGTDAKYANLRLTVIDENAPQIGDTVRMRASIFAPSPPDAPDSFDFARWLYFNKITATGYTSDIKILSHRESNGVAALRHALHKYSNSFLSDSLVLGYKNSVPAPDKQIWTATGIGHVWSISGFHITLVSGWLFIIFYSVFRLIAPITRRVPARIPATICAWLGLAFYLILSGADVATVRAFIMASLVFVALILGRNAISIRNVSIAFCVIFLINPHCIMQAGFQLSFAAIFGLVWLWDTIKPKIPHNKILRAIYATALTTITATVFTAPFTVSHFHALPLYGLVGNLILLPIFSFAIMPLVMIGTICAIFGFNAPLTWAQNIYNIAFNIATKIANLPMATVHMPNIPTITIALIILGLACIVFIRARRLHYMFGGTLILSGVITAAIYPKPIFMATSDHELIGVVQDGNLMFNKSRASNHFFTFDNWRALSGVAPTTTNQRIRAKSGVWIMDTPNFRIAYIKQFVPLSENIENLCNDNSVKYIVSYFNVHTTRCADKILRGGFIIYPNGRVKYTPSSRRWHNPQK